MTNIHYRGFGGAILTCEVHGDPDDPAVLLLDLAEAEAKNERETAGRWQEVAAALVRAGRRVFILNLAPDLNRQSRTVEPEPGLEPGATNVLVEDVRAVLGQLHVRPVLIGAGAAAAIALAALSEDGATLAAGLVLVDADAPDAADLAAAAVPTLIVEGVWRTRAGDVPSAGQSAAGQIGTALPLPSLPLSHVDHGDLGHLPTPDRHDAFGAALVAFLERRLPRVPPEYRIGADARTLRDALGCFATGVTVVTAITEEGQPVGMTANSFTSLSLDPPLLLVCIAHRAGCGPLLKSCRNFGVNVLQIGQQPISNRFATPVEDRFRDLDWAAGETGVPLLAGALGNFECTRETVLDAGDHFILIGRVVRAGYEPRRDPLLYFRGKYRRLHFA